MKITDRIRDIPPAVKRTILPDSPAAQRRRNRAGASLAASALLLGALSACGNNPHVPDGTPQCSQPSGQAGTPDLTKAIYHCPSVTVVLTDDVPNVEAVVSYYIGSGPQEKLGVIDDGTFSGNGNGNEKPFSVPGGKIYVSNVSFPSGSDVHAVFGETIVQEQLSKSTQSPQALAPVTELLAARNHATSIYTFRREIPKQPARKPNSLVLTA